MKHKKCFCASLLLLSIILTPVFALSCTTILIGKGLTADGSVIHAHNEDMGFSAVGRLLFVNEEFYQKGDTLEVPYVTIPQAERTYNYWASGNTLASTGLGIASEIRPYDYVLVGMNQWGVTMSCNWAWSKEENLEGQGIRRYAIRQLILERSKTALDAVKLVGRYIEEYGQADWGGLIYCLADSKEAWVVETTSKNWVAKRVKDNEIYVVANRFTIGSDYDLSSKNLIEFARNKGWYKKDAAIFSFSLIYGRPDKMNDPYDIDREERAKFLLEKKKGILLPEDLFIVLRDRYDGTPKYTKPQPIEMWRGANPSIPRTIVTNLCQSSTVAHLRSDMPPEVGCVMWYAMATPSYSGYFPVYAGASEIPQEFSNVSSAISQKSAWWTFRMLQKVGDIKYDYSYPLINNFWVGYHANVLAKQQTIEKRICSLINGGKREEALQLLNSYNYSQAFNILYNGQRLLRILQDETGNVSFY